MKELSIEEKAKAYDEAFKRAKILYNDKNEIGYANAESVLEEVFPLLKESDDERIRKEIIEAFKTLGDGKIPVVINYADIFTWLEKQGEQKEYTFKSIPRLLNMIEPSDKAKAYCQKLIDTLTNEGYNADAKIVGEVLKVWNGEDIPMAVMDEQNLDWSEEDKRMFDYALDMIEWYSGKNEKRVRLVSDWLKSFKDRYTWKPSDEQMNALWDKISNDNLPNSKKEISQQVALTELYEQLKKL